MKRKSSLLLWAAFPLLALWMESGALWQWRLSPGLVSDTVIRLAVWAVLVWSLIRGDWSAVFGTAVAILMLGMAAVGFRWYANRKGWRQKWLRS